MKGKKKKGETSRIVSFHPAPHQTGRGFGGNLASDVCAALMVLILWCGKWEWEMWKNYLFFFLHFYQTGWFNCGTHRCHNVISQLISWRRENWVKLSKVPFLPPGGCGRFQGTCGTKLSPECIRVSEMLVLIVRWVHSVNSFVIIKMNWPVHNQVCDCTMCAPWSRAVMFYCLQRPTKQKKTSKCLHGIMIDRKIDGQTDRQTDIDTHWKSSETNSPFASNKSREVKVFHTFM